jgi:hypothetical protein
VSLRHNNHYDPLVIGGRRSYCFIANVYLADSQPRRNSARHGYIPNLRSWERASPGFPMAHSFMTMVGSKGLTVGATIVVGVDNDLVPRPDQDLSEERRLLYVVMTRSTDALFLTWANRRRGPGARAGNPNSGRRSLSLHSTSYFIEPLAQSASAKNENREAVNGATALPRYFCDYPSSCRLSRFILRPSSQNIEHRTSLNSVRV